MIVASCIGTATAQFARSAPTRKRQLSWFCVNARTSGCGDGSTRRTTSASATAGAGETLACVGGAGARAGVQLAHAWDDQQQRPAALRWLLLRPRLRARVHQRRRRSQGAARPLTWARGNDAAFLHARVFWPNPPGDPESAEGRTTREVAGSKPRRAHHGTTYCRSASALKLLRASPRLLPFMRLTMSASATLPSTPAGSA